MLTGLKCTVTGEYSFQLCPLEEEKERWRYFETSDIHPEGKSEFIFFFQTPLSDHASITEADKDEVRMQAKYVIEWLRRRRHWRGFKAVLRWQGEVLYQWV